MRTLLTLLLLSLLAGCGAAPSAQPEEARPLGRSFVREQLADLNSDLFKALAEKELAEAQVSAAVGR